MRNLLLLSTSNVYGYGYLEYAGPLITSLFNRHGVKKVTFVPYAAQDHDQYTAKAAAAFAKLGFELEGVHAGGDPRKSVSQAEALFVGGGNTFLLLSSLYALDLLEPMRRRVIEDGVPYIGSSAGTNVAMRDIRTSNDMCIVQPPSLAALGFLPFNVNPHYMDPDPDSKHMGETREKRIAEFHELKDTPPVLGLREGSALSVSGDSVVLTSPAGGHSARLFVRGQPARELADGSDLSFLL